MNIVTGAVVGILGVWFLATALVQLPVDRFKHIRRWDPVRHLLPGWNFFAPKPVMADFAVWYRTWDSYDNGLDEVRAELSTEWRELAGIGERRLTDAVVNPGRYTRKTIFMCANQIVIRLQQLGHGPLADIDLPPDAVLLSLPYLLLVEKVSSLSGNAVAVQFRIDVVRHQGSSTLARSIFKSAIHRVARSGAYVTGYGHVAAS